MRPAAFVSIGECMIELSSGDGDLWRMGFADDTFNTAWYARAILPAEKRVAYVTALGDDSFSARMRAFIEEAGVETERIRSMAGRRPGLYAITLEGAERTFTYWRSESAACLLADDEDWLNQALADAELLYFSGITLAILAPQTQDRLLSALCERRLAGAKIAFDPNFAPSYGPTSVRRARRWKRRCGSPTWRFLRSMTRRGFSGIGAWRKPSNACRGSASRKSW